MWIWKLRMPYIPIPHYGVARVSIRCDCICVVRRHSYWTWQTNSNSAIAFLSLVACRQTEGRRNITFFTLPDHRKNRLLKHTPTPSTPPLPVCLSASLPACLSICPVVFALFLCLFGLYVFFKMFLCPSIFLYVCPPICLSAWMCLSVCYQLGGLVLRDSKACKPRNTYLSVVVVGSTGLYSDEKLCR